MPTWLKILLTGIGSFGAGATAVSQIDPHANAGTIVGLAAIQAANAIVTLFVQKPGMQPAPQNTIQLGRQGGDLQ